MSIHENMGPAVPYEYTFIRLANMGGTCYINSVLQSLYNTDMVANFCWLYDDAIKKHGLEKLVETTPLYLFVKIYVDSQNAPQNEVYYTPNWFIDALYASTNKFIRNEMGDAHEFFLYLLEEFDNSIKVLNQRLGKEGLPLFSTFFMCESTSIASYNGTITDRTKDNVPIINLDSNTIKDSIYRWENGIDIQNLNEGIDINRKLTKFPDILILQPRVFNEHMQKNPEKMKPEFKITISGQDYALKAIVVHIGNDINSGHYISIFEVSERWVHGDDAEMRPLNDQEYHRFFEAGILPGRDTATPYLFFYELL